MLAISSSHRCPACAIHRTLPAGGRRWSQLVALGCRDSWTCLHSLVRAGGERAPAAVGCDARSPGVPNMTPTEIDYRDRKTARDRPQLLSADPMGREVAPPAM